MTLLHICLVSGLLFLIYGFPVLFLITLDPVPATLLPFPAVVAPVLAPLTKYLPTPPPTRPTTTLANHGVAQTLATILAGRKTFVIAYAVATSTNMRLDSLLTPHLLSSSFTFVAPSINLSPFSIALLRGVGVGVGGVGLFANPNHPFRVKYRPNFSAPSVMYFASVQ